MAEQISLEAVETVEQPAKKAAPKRKAKAPAKRKPVARKAAAKKPAAKRKPAAKKPAAKKAAKPDFAAKARENGRNVFLASLGFYGKAYDQAQEQYDNLQKQLEEGREKAEKTYKELVKRGEKVEKDVKKSVDEIELPKFELDSLTDRKKLDEQLEKAKARFEELKESVGFNKSAA